MNSLIRNSVIWAFVLLVEAIILKLAKSMRLWIYVVLPIIAGFAVIELLKPQNIIEFWKPQQIVVKKRNLK